MGRLCGSRASQGGDLLFCELYRGFRNEHHVGFPEYDVESGLSFREEASINAGGLAVLSL